MQDSTFSRTIYGSGASSGQTGFYGEIQESAFLGNSFDGGGYGEHVWRLQQGVKMVIAHNDIAHPAPTKEVVTIRATPHVTAADDTQYIVFSDNKLTGGIYNDGVNTNPVMMTLMPESGTDDERIIDAILERNYFVFAGGATVGTQIGLEIVPYQYMSIRNNIFNTDGGKAHQGIQATNYGLITAPDSIWIYNNTAYSSETDNDFVIVDFATALTNAIANNNLGYSPNDSQHQGISCVGSSTLTLCTGLTVNTNSSAAQVGATDPLFDNTANPPTGFRIGAGSYAYGTGTAAYPATADNFLHCRNQDGSANIGAMGKRATDICAGAR